MRTTLDALAANGPPAGEITATIAIAARPASLSPVPAWLDGRMRQALAAAGIAQLYCHQAECLDLVRQGRDVFVTTPTASGKSLCFHLPVFQALLADPRGRALYLFPAKALAHDQLFALRELQAALTAAGGAGDGFNPAAYDGDTPVEERPAIRRGARVVLTNPEMLHQAILPHHDKWRPFFSALKLVVLDEVHLYQGLFGSHVANVIRRLGRVCRHYGSVPRFICGSATLTDPADLGRRLLGREVAAVSRNGAPSGERHILMCDPGRSLVPATIRWASFLIRQGRRVIVFCPSRLAVERTVAGLRREVADTLPPDALHGYRGGYAPAERRLIESGLRDGRVRAVVGTNALELGIDIGSLDTVVLAGYPGSIAATWQRIGRAGRRDAPSLAVLLAGPSPLDRYLIRNPEYIGSRPPEACLLDPDNRMVAGVHARCASAELPFRPGEGFGNLSANDLASLPPAARDESRHQPIRPGGRGRLTIEDAASSRPIGDADGQAARLLMYPGAVYLHDGSAYRVTAADNGNGAVRVAPVAAEDAGRFSSCLRLQEVAVRRVVARRRQAWGATGPGASGPAPVAGPAVCIGYGEIATTTAATLARERDLPAGRTRTWANVGLAVAEPGSHGAWISLPPGTNRLFPRTTFAAAWENAGALALAVSPMLLASAAGDLRLLVQCDPPAHGRPTLFFIEAWPGGLGIAERMYRLMGDILLISLRSAARCPCPAGCPTCLPASAGPAVAKRLMLDLLHALCHAG